MNYKQVRLDWHRLECFNRVGSQEHMKVRGRGILLNISAISWVTYHEL